MAYCSAPRRGDTRRLGGAPSSNKVLIINEVHTPHRDMPLHEIIWLMRHDGCGGGAGRPELLTGIEGASTRPVRKIILVAG
jgi:hypothetical protein